VAFEHLHGAAVDSRFFSIVLVTVLVSVPVVSEGQSSPPPVRSLVPIGKKAGEGAEIPKRYLPPPGMCRIWIDNVPPAQQPAPTDCPSAIKNRPSNGRVIFAEDGGRGGQEPRGRERRSDKDSSAGKDTTDERSSRDRKESKSRRP